MSNRFVVALALSGALHAGLLVAASGLQPWLLAGLERVHSTETFTVSIRGVNSEAQAAKKPHRAKRSKPQPPPVLASNTPPKPVSDGRVVHDVPARHPVKPELPRAQATEAQPDQVVAKATPEPDGHPEEAEIESNPGQPAAARRHSASASRASTPPGSGNLEAEGDSGESAERTYLAEFLAALSRYKHYPQSARLRREEGRVVVALVLESDGTINDVQLKEPSRFPLLNRAALRSVRQLDKFKPFPAGMQRSAWQLSVPFQYAIRDQ